jgi:BUD22
VAEKVEAAKQQRDEPYLNVSARLFKSNYVVDAVDQAVKSVSQAMGVPEAHTKKKRLRKADLERAKKVARPRTPWAPHKFDKSPDPVIEFMQNISDSEGGDSIDPEPRASAPLRPRDSSSLPEEHATPEDPSESKKASATNAKDVKDHAKETKISRTEPAAPKSTAFLPSLATGYFSGSDSDGSSIEDIEDEKPRKNRRGQRARQAIAQLKYGSKANHLKGQQRDRDHGWDPKRGAQDESNANVKGYRGNDGKAPGFGSDKRDTRPNTTPRETSRPQTLGQKNRADQGPLHPSWEAAKKQKEQKSLPAFQGKKVVFD